MNPIEVMGGVLPVVGPHEKSNIYVTAGTYDITVPTDEDTVITLMAIEGLAGTSWYQESSGGAFPGTWPPAANVTDGSVTWVRVAENQIREVNVKPGHTFTLEVPTDSVVQVIFY